MESNERLRHNRYPTYMVQIAGNADKAIALAAKVNSPNPYKTPSSTKAMAFTGCDTMIAGNMVYSMPSTAGSRVNRLIGDTNMRMSNAIDKEAPSHNPKEQLRAAIFEMRALFAFSLSPNSRAIRA